MKRIWLIAAMAMAMATLCACQRAAIATPTTDDAAADAARKAQPAPTAPTPSGLIKPSADEQYKLPDTGLIKLGIGQSAPVAADATLRFDRIVSDSRCPADVQCIWAGEVRIALTLTTPEGKTEFELAQITKSTASVQSFEFELVSFEACMPDKSAASPVAECASLRIGAAMDH